VLNLRFVIFSAAVAPALHAQSLARRIVGGFLLTDTAFAVLGEKLATARDPVWRWSYYIVPSIYGWVLWQTGVLIGVFGAGFFPRGWSLEFMGTIALMIMVVPMVRSRPMLVAALVGGLGAVLLRGLPLRLGLFAAILLGIAAGFAAEHWHGKKADI
jgi:predicted branched-subunit amino acid permease